jgi:hypothetical protein
MNIDLEFPFIKGMTFGFQAKQGDFARKETYESFEMMAETLNINTVVLPIVAWQENAHSVKVIYDGDRTVSEWEIENMIDFAQHNGLRVILKPMVGIIDGTPCDYIDFSDKEVQLNNSWEEWFKSYTEFILHMADIASRTGCSILSAGSGLVRSEKCENEWRALIAAVRERFNGFVTYNACRFSEDSINWWDALDLISSSGYYLNKDIPAQIEHIKTIVKKYKKPFMFLETGCESCLEALNCPDKRDENSLFNADEQAEYYKNLFSATSDLPWLCGYGLWEWPLNLNNIKRA